MSPTDPIPIQQGRPDCLAGVQQVGLEVSDSAHETRVRSLSIRLATMLALAADAMLFLGLLAATIVLRAANPAGVSGDFSIISWPVIAGLAAMLLGSLAAAAAKKYILHPLNRQIALVIAAGAGIAYCAIAWHEATAAIRASGRALSLDPRLACYVTIADVHAAHVAVLVILSLGFLVRADAPLLASLATAWRFITVVGVALLWWIGRP